MHSEVAITPDHDRNGIEGAVPVHAYRLSEIPMSRQFLVLFFSCERGKGVFISRLLLSQ
jgi:hypothetical protein